LGEKWKHYWSGSVGEEPCGKRSTATIFLGVCSVELGRVSPQLIRNEMSKILIQLDHHKQLQQVAYFLRHFVSVDSHLQNLEIPVFFHPKWQRNNQTENKDQPQLSEIATKAC
jgi:hypothetical protein